MRVPCAVMLLAVAGLASADTLTLRNGQVIHGSYLGGSSRQIKLVVDDAIRTFDVDDVVSLTFDRGAAAAVAAPAQQPVAVPAPTPAATLAPATKILKVDRPEAAPLPAPAETGIELSAGTPVTIRMIDGVDSKQARVGQTFRASLDEPVMAGDVEAIPKGADVVTKLVEMKEAGKIAGGGQLTLELVSITVNGRVVAVNTQSVTQAGQSGKGDSAKVIGGTAALGAIIGAIAGGGKGAAIGTIAGAGAGTAVRVATSGAHVEIPSETRLTFTLQQPARI